MKIFSILPLFLLVVLAVSHAWADGAEAGGAGQKTKSIAGRIDKRLPPLLPGQEVNDGAKSMNIWSTSGSVSSGPAPELAKSPDSAGGRAQIPQVIVDERRLGINTENASN